MQIISYSSYTPTSSTDKEGVGAKVATVLPYVLVYTLALPFLPLIIVTKLVKKIKNTARKSEAARVREQSIALNSCDERVKVKEQSLLTSAWQAIVFLLLALPLAYLFLQYFNSTVIEGVFDSYLYDYFTRQMESLEFSKEDNADIDKLNLTMQQFALEDMDGYNEEGFLEGEGENLLSASTLIKEPVKFTKYIVKAGDTIGKITAKSGLKNLSTIIAVNDIDNVRSVREGQTLTIPSIDGLYYTVKKGNTLEGLSNIYHVSIEELVDVNEIESEELQEGERLFIPNARLDKAVLQNALGTLFKCPLVNKYRISSPFGRRLDPITGVKSYHTGLDMATPQGNPIVASSAGEISFAGFSNIFGNYIIINHSGGYQTLYGHMSKILAKKGQWVSQGTRIGLVGSTGYSTGPHLHFTVYKNGKLLDPASLINK